MAVPGITWREREFPTGTRRKKMETTARQKAPRTVGLSDILLEHQTLGQAWGHVKRKERHKNSVIEVFLVALVFLVKTGRHWNVQK